METFHFHNAFDGGSKYVHYLSEELVKKGINVTVVTTKLKDNPKLKETVYNGVSYIFLPPVYTGVRRIFPNIPYKFVFSYNLMKYLQKTNFDILHSTESFAWWYLHKKERKPVIYQTWGMEAWYGKETLRQKGISKLYIKLFLRKPWQYVLEKSDSIAADGEFQVPRITKLGVSEDKIFLLPNGVNFYQIQNMKKSYEDKRKELGIKKDDLLILSTGQIAPDKGIDDIIKGFALLKKDIPNAKLLMVGRGILEEDMYKWVKEEGLELEKDVFHRKNVPEKVLYDYYFSSDLFVAATLSEEFMITIQEAMACGLPIVSSAQPYLVDNGKNGFVVGFKNPLGIRDALLKIYNSGKSKMKKMGEVSKKMAEKYDYSFLADTCIKEYNKLLSLKKV
ncbi:MAG: glycosyltransferase family 4 protein [Candidatus Nanoarchaeia archaeon]